MPKNSLNTPIVILAGGQGERMGKLDKCLLKIDADTVLTHLIENLSPQTQHLFLNVNGELDRFNDYSLKCITDSIDPPIGPLGGILASLRAVQEQNLSSPYILTVAGDCPFLPKNLCQQLLEKAQKDAEVVFASSGGRDHFVNALWAPALLPKLEQFVADGKRSVGKFIFQQNYQKVEFDSKDVDPFFNINTPDQFTEAKNVANKVFS